MTKSKLPNRGMDRRQPLHIYDWRRNDRSHALCGRRTVSRSMWPKRQTSLHVDLPPAGKFLRMTRAQRRSWRWCKSCLLAARRWRAAIHAGLVEDREP